MSTLARGVLAVLVSLTVWALAPAAFGMTSTTVMSGSMAPALQAGDVVVAHPVAPGDLRVGAVLLVDDPDHAGRLRLHRLVAVEDGALRLRGDANVQADSSTVTASHVHGVAFLRVPYSGLPMLWTRTGEWLRVALFAAGTATLMALVGVDRLLPDERATRRRTPAGAPAAAVLALVLVLVAASTAPPSAAWAGFGSATTPPKSTFAAGSFPCLTAPRTPAASVAATVDYRFAEPTGTTVQNLAATGNDGLLLESVDHLAGSCVAGSGPGVLLGAAGRGAVVVPGRTQSPGSMTIAVWFRTGTGGGLLAGFGSSGTADPSGTFDRQLVLNTDGSLTFKVLVAGGATSGINAPAIGLKGYADDQWHLAVVTLSGVLGMSIAVDGVVVIQSLLSLSLTSYQGYYRFGYDAIPGSTTTWYRGSMARVQIWAGTSLGATDVANLYAQSH